MNRILKFTFFLLVLGACTKVPENIEPSISYSVQDKYLKALPAPFAPLSESEKETAWGKEYLIGITFARQLDLYQAITAFKRAEILIPASERERRFEVIYEILLCYYMGEKYSEATHVFETTDLEQVDEKFPAFHDLLLVLYDCYQKTGDEEKAARTLGLIQHYYPQEYEKLTISSALIKADLPKIQKISEQPSTPSYLQNFLTDYNQEKKSVATAQGLNAALPGAGYFYLGQINSGVTALILNGLFIAGTVHFFQTGHIAAGAIFAGFEAGWYFGGIYGAGLEAKYYNERLYEKKATPLMNQQGLFPVLMLQCSF
jgi:tetratricopeptide (TPR) repeat protein